MRMVLRIWNKLPESGVGAEHTRVQITGDLFLWLGGLRDENAKPWDSAKLNKGIHTAFWTRCLFPEKILLPNDSGANFLSAETESQEPLIWLWEWHVTAGRGFLPGFLLIQVTFLSAKYVHKETSPTGFGWGLDFGRAWVGAKQGRESWWRLLKTCFMFNRVQRGSLKPAVGSVEKSARPEQWLWHNRKQKNTSSPECFYSEAKFLWHPRRQQNPGSPEDWALPTRHHLKADDCKGFDISSNTELS